MLACDEDHEEHRRHYLHKQSLITTIETSTARVWNQGRVPEDRLG